MLHLKSLLTVLILAAAFAALSPLEATAQQVVATADTVEVAVATVAITVTPVNDLPSVIITVQNGDEGAPIPMGASVVLRDEPEVRAANVPDGQTEFQFKAGNLNFHSSAYEWLVVTGGCMAQYNGEGTVNGEAGQ